jgi:hypothetical protein
MLDEDLDHTELDVYHILASTLCGVVPSEDQREDAKEEDEEPA